MTYREDSSEQGNKCEIIIKGETLYCVVICAFEWTDKNKVVKRKYRLEAKDKTIYDNVSTSDIIFKK